MPDVGGVTGDSNGLAGRGRGGRGSIRGENLAIAELVRPVDSACRFRLPSIAATRLDPTWAGLSSATCLCHRYEGLPVRGRLAACLNS